ncbi:MAG TPA: DoxX family protein [Acidimicrobiales bacterium]|nr:DoxX family protein [Acidimicrobiales bacterium]
MAVVTLPVPPQQASGLLLAVQATDAVACAIPLEVIRQDLERLGCPPWLQRTIPVVKGASVVGLLVGRRHPRLGRLTTDALVAYFLCALGAHARVRDPAWRWAAAAGMLGLTIVARQAYAERGPEPEVIDLTGDTGPLERPAPLPEDETSASEAAPAEPAEA